MFTQSRTAALISLIYQLIKNSFAVSVIVSVINRMKGDFASSRFLKVLRMPLMLIRKPYEHSWIKGSVHRDSVFQRLYSGSLFSGIICFVYRMLSVIAGSIFNFAERLSGRGLINCASKTLVSKGVLAYHRLFGCFIAIMLVCPHEMWNNIYAVVAAIGFLAALMISGYRRKAIADIGSVPAGMVLFALFLIVSVSYAYATKDGIRIALFLLSAMAFCFCTGECANTRDKLTELCKIICVAVAITSVIGIIQRFMGVEVDPEFVDIAANENMPGRVFSTFSNPNNFAELLVLAIPLTVALFVTSKCHGGKAFWGICVILNSVALAMTYSRSCWIAIALAVLVTVLVYDKKLIIPIAIAALVAIPFLPETVTDRILTIGSMSDTSNSSRLYIWAGAMRTVQNVFVSGVGPGPVNFAAYYRPVADVFAVNSAHSHMLYLELIIEFGIFGAMSFFLYLLSCIKRGFVSSAMADKSQKMVIAALLGSLIGMLFVFVVEYVWFYPRDMFIYWIVIGLLWAAVKNVKRADEDIPDVEVHG